MSFPRPRTFWSALFTAVPPAPRTRSLGWGAGEHLEAGSFFPLFLYRHSEALMPWVEMNDLYLSRTDSLTGQK